MIKTLTPGEIARLCDVHQRTVSRWIASGKLKGHQLPGRGDYRVVEADFLAFAESHGLPVSTALANRKTLLVVDDEAPVRAALNRLFSMHGYTVIEAENSFAAGALLEREQPALITLDLMMPGICLEQVFEFLKAQSHRARIPVFVISAAPEATLQRARELGAADVIAKPFNNSDILDRIAAVLRKEGVAV